MIGEGVAETEEVREKRTGSFQNTKKKLNQNHFAAQRFICNLYTSTNTSVAEIFCKRRLKFHLLKINFIVFVQ